MPSLRKRTKRSGECHNAGSNALVARGSDITAAWCVGRAGASGIREVRVRLVRLMAITVGNNGSHASPVLQGTRREAQDEALGTFFVVSLPA